MRTNLSPLAMSISLALLAIHSVSAAEMVNDSAELESITVTASADASAEGLSPAHSGGQVAVGGRAGILGTLDHLDSPFNITAYTNEFIQDRQARSVGDVLQNDPSVRVARGFGNFQESYFIRGFVLSSDDIAYNGLYSLLPRQYIATELFERVELLRGASSFLSGASPSGGGIGGNVNLLPKRAPNEPLNRITVGTEHGQQGLVSADIARRFGEEKQFGLRVNTAYRDGGTAIDDEETQLGLFSVGLDWRGDRARLSADIGYQDNQLDETRTNVTLLGLDRIPSAPNSDSNWAQPWSYSDEQDWFGTMRGEYDVTETTTAWAAYGLRRTEEENSLANIRVTDANSGQGNFFRFDNARKDEVDTGELGLRGLFNTGNVGHEWVMSASFFELDSKKRLWDRKYFINQLIQSC
ncbi:TonB-dependent receptor [Methylophaga muralis]|uniref:Ferrichrome receptor FcuA n=1 Tax=Methylophaga muralis TaxID=291169 RepID=A0A1E3GP67_9GAMM|nr:TonB-dependent receptor plug domain-containing protein [Methylophaga muralis]ODN65824.1 Ferrichrome receptor FcuA precursor [Methylophaga muralis]